MDDRQLLEVLHAAADAVRRALDRLDDWGPSGSKPGQYRSDLAADDACLTVLDDAGLGWLSEESGIAHADRPLLVFVDPVDGSTNASRGIPWFATSLCVVDEGGPRVALVADQANDRRFSAISGEGAWRDETRIEPSDVTAADTAIVGISGHPVTPIGRQFRALNAVALDLCMVASGTLDGFVDCSPPAHGVWDYAAGALICQEAGAFVGDAFGHELLVRDHAARRTPVAGATSSLFSELRAYRRSFGLQGDPSVRA